MRSLLLFAQTFMAELARPRSIPEPSLRIVPQNFMFSHEEDIQSSYAGFVQQGQKLGNTKFDQNTIIINQVWEILWEEDKEEAEPLLKYVLAHEFYHYLLYIKQISTLLPRMEERRADDFARRISNIQSSYFNANMPMLADRYFSYKVFCDKEFIGEAERMFDALGIVYDSQGQGKLFCHIIYERR